MKMPLKECLSGTYFLDTDHPEVIAFTKQNTKERESKLSNIISLYYAIRDGFRYNPYEVILKPEKLKASYLLTKNSGYCIEKAILLAACARIIGVPSKLHFYNVRNHIGTEKLTESLGTDVLVFHGITEVWISNKWIKSTPAFNKELCEKLKVSPLEFNGEEDSIFQEYNSEGSGYMEYLYDYGDFLDFPFSLFCSELNKYYPKFFRRGIDF